MTSRRVLTVFCTLYSAMVVCNEISITEKQSMSYLSDSDVRLSRVIKFAKETLPAAAASFFAACCFVVVIQNVLTWFDSEKF